MRFGVILNLDADAAGRIREIQQALTGGEDDDPFDLYDMIYGVEPHLTLALYDEVERPLIDQAIDKTFRDIGLIPIDFASIALFPGSVLYLAPRVTVELLELHRAYHRNTEAMASACNLHYLPDAWVPHCSLGVPAPAEDLSQAMLSVGYGWTPVAGHLVSVELVSYPPVTSLHRRDFS